MRRLSNFRQRQQKSTPIIQQATADRVNRSCSQTQKDEWLIRLVAYASQRLNQWPAPDKEREREAHLWLRSRPMPSWLDAAGDCRAKEGSLATERISDTRPIDAKNRDFSTVDHTAAIRALIKREISIRLIFNDTKPLVPVDLTWHRTGNLLGWSKPAVCIFKIST